MGRYSEIGATQSTTDADVDSKDSSSNKSSDVLFLAATLFESNNESIRSEARFSYLTYLAGETFDVITAKGELWLAMNQDYPDSRMDYIWEKHFAKLTPNVEN